MIKVSESALNQLKKILSEENIPEGGIRIGVRGSGNCGLNYYLGIQKEKMAGDKHIQLDGIHIFMDEFSMEKLNTLELDYIVSPVKTGFVFKEINSSANESSGKCRN
jgi:iron-sulfur cluster assembly protein